MHRGARNRPGPSIDEGVRRRPPVNGSGPRVSGSVAKSGAPERLDDRSGASLHSAGGRRPADRGGVSTVRRAG